MSEVVGNRIESLLSAHLFAAKWNLGDWLFFFVLIPEILTIFYFIPYDLKHTYLILHSESLSLAPLYFSNFVHSNMSHFIGNMGSYIMVCFLIFNFETNKRNFYLYSFLMFLWLPWIISLASMDILRLESSHYQGFSGLVSSLFGYLTYVIYKFMKQHCCRNVNYTFVLLIICMNVLQIIGTISSEIFDHVLIIACSMILVFLQKDAIVEIVQKHFDIGEWLKKIPDIQKIYIASLLIVTLNFIFILPVLIPAETIHNGAVVNTVGHSTGYFFGIIIPLFLSAITDGQSQE